MLILTVFHIAKKVGKIYRKVYLLKHPEIAKKWVNVTKGEFLVVVGPSGSGKTTLLNLIGAIDKPTSGRIFIDGRDVTTLGEGELTKLRRHKIGFIFQFYNLIPALTALEDVELPILTASISRKDAEKRASQLLETVGLAERVGHLPDELSGGEQQR